MKFSFRTALLAIAAPLALLTSVYAAPARVDSRAQAERDVRNTIEPVLQKYCPEECRLLAVKAEVASGGGELLSPGFDESPSDDELAIERVEVKLLLDDRLGKVRRARITDLLNQLFTAWEYPVDLQSRSSKFPSETDSAQRISEIRERLRKNFEGIVADVFSRYCPRNCLFSQFELETEPVSLEESQGGNPSDYFELHGTAVRIDSIGGTLVFDRLIPDADQKNLQELVELRAHPYTNLELKTKVIDFPRIKGEEEAGWVSPFADRIGADGRIIRGAGSNAYTDSTTETKNHSELDSRYSRKDENRSDSASNFKSDSKSDSKATERLDRSEKNSENREDKYTRTEKIERVENGDALHGEFQRLQLFGGVISAVILLLLGWLLFRREGEKSKSENDVTFRMATPAYAPPPAPSAPPSYANEADTTRFIRAAKIEPTLRFQIQNLRDSLITLFVENPRVTKHVFTKILIEEGIETTAAYVSIFGETIVMEILRDPSLQADVSSLIEFYATTPIEIAEEDQLDLLKKLQARSVSGKLSMLSQVNQTFFDFLSDLDPAQIYALVRDESMAVKGLVVTQTDLQKRNELIAQFDADSRARLMTELTRMEYLPKDYIRNVASSLRRKLKENAQLNTTPLASQEVLINLLQESDPQYQGEFIRALEHTHPRSAKRIKSQFVTLDVLPFLPPGKMVEVLLALKHDELLVLFKSMAPRLLHSVIQLLPTDLANDLQEELMTTPVPLKEQAAAVERKIVHRLRAMASERVIDLSEVNDLLYSSTAGESVAPPTLRKVG